MSDLEKAAKCLALVNSDNDGEAVAAARKFMKYWDKLDIEGYREVQRLATRSG